VSVRTTADEQLDHAKADIQTAIEHLSQIIVERCWGWGEFREDYRKDIAQSLADLIVIRDRLGE
jgi:hypothetical protein